MSKLKELLTARFCLEYFPLYSVVLDCAEDRCATVFFPHRKLSGKFGVLYDEEL